MEQEKEQENKAGLKVLAKSVQQDNPTEDDPPHPKNFWETIVDLVQGFAQLISSGSQPTASPTLPPPNVTIIHAATATSTPTLTPTLSPTTTPMFTPTPRPTSSYLEDQLQTYGIQLRGGDNGLTGTILQAAQLAAQTFQPLTGGTPQQSFIMSHGTLAIIVNENANIGNGMCITERVVPGTRYWPYTEPEPSFNVGTTITCNEAPTLTVLLHEFGHAFDNNYRIHGSPNQGHLLSDSLEDLIVRGNYIRQILLSENGTNNVARTSLGFNGSQAPSLENPWTPTRIEEFGDTYLNGVLDRTSINPNRNGFSDNEYGDARRNEWGNLTHQWQNDMQGWFDAFLQ